MSDFALKVKGYYDLGLWKKERVREAVEAGKLSEGEYREIVGEVY